MTESRTITSPAVRALSGLQGVKAIKAHGSVYMELGTPDIAASAKMECPHCGARGQAFLLEGKKPGRKPSAIQRKRLREWNDAGAIVGIIYSVAEAVAVVQGDTEMQRVCYERTLDKDAGQ